LLVISSGKYFHLTDSVLGGDLNMICRLV